MQSVPREWLDFLRQQFPKDSRIQLTEIGGNPRPISPGSTGKLDYIDDAGQFHVKWDNGCTLALVLGEDRFSVYLPEPQTFKLYMPLTADFYGRDEWGDMSEDGEEWDGHTLMDYEGQILSALVKNRVPEENESGLMRWYGEDDSVDHKVRSAVFTVEVRNRQLWGVAECRVAGELTPEELILVDFDKRDDDKTSANILILGNSGQGKSYLLKLLLLNFLEAGKSVISLDVEHEQKDMCETVGGCFMDLMGGVYRINPLEPKCWDDGSGPEDRDAPEAFRKSTRLSQHISFLKDFFRAYKDFSDRHIDAIEIMVGKLYAKWGISDSTNFAGLKPQDYPILSDLYKLIEQEYREYDGNCHQLYTAELLQEILLGLHSMCQGAEAQFFNGHTNVTSSRFIVFGVKGLLQASKNVRGAMLFNILSYMSDRLLTIGNTTAALDELYVWLSDNVSVGTTIIEYIRNTLKRVRKKESNLIMASQNLEDFDREGIRELTKPLFAIPPHQFIFNCGSIDKRFYMDLLQLEEAEYNLIRFPQRGVCLFKCGNERYLLEVHAPAYKEALFGTAGGR